jgi:hypothetical protein
MELTWINKLRIAAVAAVGIVVIGLLAWPLAAPADPLAPVRASNISLPGTMALLVLAFGVGFGSYFVAWPHGREIGILAVPFGLAVWAGRSGPMRVLTQTYGQPDGRQALVSSLRFEPMYWLLIVAAGFAGVLLAQHWRRAPRREEGENAQAEEGRSTASRPALPALLPASLRSPLFSALLALAASVLLAHFFVGIFTQDVATSRNTGPTQPLIGQIFFGVMAAFAVAAFILKKFANLSYVWPAVGSMFVTAFTQAIYGHAQTLRQFAETRPATFFPHTALAILPIQFVALGTLGSILGYWMAVRYDWWRKHDGAA